MCTTKHFGGGERKGKGNEHQQNDRMRSLGTYQMNKETQHKTKNHATLSPTHINPRSMYNGSKLFVSNQMFR